MSQNCFWFCTSSSAKKDCAPPKAAHQIRLEKWGETSGRRFAPPTPPLVQNRRVLFWCLYFTKLAPIFKIADASHARSAWRLWIKSYVPWKPRRPPPLSLRRQPRRNFPLQFFFCARPLKKIQKRKGKFLLGSALQVFGQCGGASMRTRFCQTIFLGKRIWQNLGWFPARRKGSGEWMRAGFWNFWRRFF